MIPYDAAMAVYRNEPCARSFFDDFTLHMKHGFVFSTPDYFIMGRPVNSKAAEAQIVDPACTFKPEECDCWHVYLMAGDVTKVWNIMPYPLPKVSFERRNELRFYTLDSIRRIQTNPIP